MAITSAQSANWNLTTTWVGGAIPTADDDAIIAAGHVIPVSGAGDAVCKSLASGGAGATLNMGAKLLSVVGTLTGDNLAIVAVMAGASISATSILIGTGGSLTLMAALAVTVSNENGLGFELCGGTLNMGGYGIALSGNLIGTSGTLSNPGVITFVGNGSINSASFGCLSTARIEVDAGVSVTFVQATTTMLGRFILADTASVTNASGKTLNLYGLATNDFLRIPSGTANGLNATVRLVADRSNAYGVHIAGGLFTQWATGAGKTLTQTGNISCGNVAIYANSGTVPELLDMRGTLAATGKVTLGTATAANINGHVKFTNGNHSIGGNIGRANAANLANALTLNSAKVTLGGTFNGANIAVTSTGAEFSGAGSLTNVGNVAVGGTLSGDIYAPIAMDGGGNDVTAPDSVIFMAADFFGCYRLYRGGTPSQMDYATALASVPAGTGEIKIAGLGLAAGGECWLAVRATSAAGIEESNTNLLAVEIDGEGKMVPPAPEGIAHFAIRQAAGGKVAVRLMYHQALFHIKGAAATAVEIIRDEGGGLDFSPGNLLATVALAAEGTTHHAATLDEVYADGESVRLAARAVTAAGGASAPVRSNTITADSAAPADIDHLEAIQT